MDLASLIPLVNEASTVLIVFALGLQVSPGDLLSIGRRPAQLLRSLLAINVIMPIVAATLAVAFHLQPAVQIALVALALCPVPPRLPKKQLKAGGSPPFAFGLLVVVGLFAIVFVPIALKGVIGPIFAVPVHLPARQVAQIVLVTVLGPLCIGLAVRRVAPSVAERVARPLSEVATVALVAATMAIMVSAWPAMVSLLENGTLVAFAGFIVVGLTVGHLLGGPDPGDRTVLALSTASRHPGVALAIADANFPDQKLVLPAVFCRLDARV
jgi:bile acid:Na+ symporter, BASS family